MKVFYNTVFLRSLRPTQCYFSNASSNMEKLIHSTVLLTKRNKSGKLNQPPPPQLNKALVTALLKALVTALKGLKIGLISPALFASSFYCTVFPNLISFPYCLVVFQFMF